jgi:hypothetical protein
MAVPMKRQGVSWMWVLLLGGLSLLAWISTYSGIMELIIASTGEVGILEHIAIGFAVFMLQLMILYILDAMFSGQLRWWLWPLYVIGYIILFVISVGFAFGFYWKYLEAGSVTTQAAETSIVQVQRDLQLGTSRLEQLQSTFTSLAAVSAEKAERERNVGGTCPGSRPGDGPRRRLREADAQRFQFANDFIAQRVTSVKTDIADLNTDLQKVLRDDPSVIDPATGSRGVFIGELNRKLGLVSARFNALGQDPQLLQLRDELRTRAAQTSFSDDRGGSFICPDQQLQSALNGVVRAIDQLPQLQQPELRAFEGSEAVIEAFRRLTNSGIGWTNQMASAVTGAPAPAVEDGLTQRDYIPLIIAIFVDICILLVSINRPFGPFFELNRSMEEARRGGMNDYLETFYKVFQNQFDPDRRPTAAAVIAPIQDVVFDYRGQYYAAVPLDFREEDYKEWLAQRTGPSAAETIFQATSDRPLEVSRYITSVFATLEGNGFVRLVEASEEGLDTALIKQKLDQQGSVYGQADAFRVYRFRRNAWAQILLQSVGSGANFGEATARQRIKEGSWERPAIGVSREQTEGLYRGEVRAEDAPKPAVTDEARRRPAIEYKAGEGDGSPRDAEYGDPDPDDNSYSEPKLNNRPEPNGDDAPDQGPRKPARQPGGGGSPVSQASAPENIGIIARFRRLFGRA